jgi:hypothetical protein
MADDTQLGAASGVGDVISTDDLGTKKVQRVKVQFGADGSATDASSANPLPVAPAATTNAGATAKTFDYDTGAGTDTVTSFGIALPASGGAVAGGTATNPVRTDTTGTTTQPVSAASLPLPAGASTAAKQPALGTAGSPSADVISVQGVASGTAIPVSGTVTASGPLTDTQLRASAVPVSGTVTANAGSGPFPSAGTVAHDGADSGNPVKVGARARTSDVTAVAADDRTDAIADILGKQVVLPYALPGQATNGTGNSTGTGNTSVIAAPGAGVTLYITSIIVTNAHATVGTKVAIKDGTTAKINLFAAANGGGATIPFPTPLRLTANTALQFANTTTGADVDVSAVGYTAAA